LAYYLAYHIGLLAMYEPGRWHLDFFHHRIKNTKCLAWFQTALGFQGPLEPKKNHVHSRANRGKQVTCLVLLRSTKPQVKYHMESWVTTLFGDMINNLNVVKFSHVDLSYMLLQTAKSNSYLCFHNKWVTSIIAIRNKAIHAVIKY
jgi:hypothetical protein